MISAQLSKNPDQTTPLLLSELFEAAGILEYASWSNQVHVCPGGREDLRPYPFQISGLNHLAANLPRCGLWDDPGCGKTLQLQAFASWMAGIGNKVVAVMLPVLVPQFRDSFNATFPGIQKHIKIEVLYGERPQRQKIIDRFNTEGWPDILITSYEIFRGRSKAPKVRPTTPTQEKLLLTLPPEEQLKHRQALAAEAQRKQVSEDAKYRSTSRKPIDVYTLNSETLKRYYNLLICDEAQVVKTHKSQAHIAVRDFVEPWNGDNSNGLVLATGSPIETNATDAFGLINLIDPKRYGTMRAFENQHCVFDPNPRNAKYPKIIDYKNMRYLHQSLYARGRRITKKQAFPDMPTRIVTELRIALHPNHKTLYNDLVEKQVLQLEGSVIDATKQQRLYQYAQQILVRPDKFTDTPPKTNTVLDETDGLLETLAGHKVILFAWYQDSISLLAQRYADHNPAVINGNVTGLARERAKKKFIDDPTCRLLIANPESGGVGLDGFQKICSYAIFVEVYPHPGGFEQAVGRLERSGQTETVNIFLIVPVGTISVRLRNDLCRKESFANAVVQDPKLLLSEMLGKTEFTGIIR